MSEEEKTLLRQKLWSIANDLRGKMDPIEFKDYILSFIFFKHISQKISDICDGYLDGTGYSFESLAQADQDDDFIGTLLTVSEEDCKKDFSYYLPPELLFSSFVKRKGEFILDDVGKAFSYIENSVLGTKSEDAFKGLFEDCNLNSSRLGRTPDERSEIIYKIISHLNAINFKSNNTKGDLLGDAYEYLISKFAGSAGKKAGEFYTPHSVSTVLAKIVSADKQRLHSVYDPTCGSGSLLLNVSSELDDGVDFYYGQEQNRTTFNLARMNMILHDVAVENFDIRHGDTLMNPLHDQKFSAIVANPPFSAKWSADPKFLDDPRFSNAGRLAPRTKADFAFIQHMIHHLDENGTLAIVMPHGVLFRGAAEGHIRKHLIHDLNIIDAVIGLPANIFFGTSIPTCVLVLKKCRKNDDNILFIDASNHFEKAKNQNVLRDSDIDKITDAYRKREFEDKYSYVAPLSEVEENDYNLNIPRYVDTFEEEEPVDLDAVSLRLQEIEDEMKGTDATIADFCQQLGIKEPF